jgi:fumarate hydratase class I
MAVGGAAYLVSKAIQGSRLLAFEDLGMEAIYEFDVVDMPVTVAVDSKGTSVHKTGPAEWQQRIAAVACKAKGASIARAFCVARVAAPTACPSARQFQQ